MLTRMPPGFFGLTNSIRTPIDPKVRDIRDRRDTSTGMTFMPQSNESDLKLRDLRVLEVMLDERSLTRAALRLDTTQPSLSKALSRLRAHFGDPLLVRDGAAMRPTPKGAEMLAPVRELLYAASAIGNPATGPFD